jgi:hypothetical protein
MCCYDGARLIAVLANSMSLWTDAIAYFFFLSFLGYSSLLLRDRTAAAPDNIKETEDERTLSCVLS